MKRFQSLISASLALTIAFAACTNGATDKAPEDSTEPTSATVENKAEGDGQKIEANKKLVSEFYQSFYGDKDSTSIDKYIADNVIQHNPLVKDGKEWLKSALRPFLENPNIGKTKVDIKRIIAEGDMVWVMVKEIAPNGKAFARVEIFRVENGKIAENWLVYQQVPDKSENTNTMF